MEFVTKASILASKDRLKSKVLYTPDWGGYTLIIELTGKQRDAYENELMVRQGNRMVPQLTNARAKLVAKCIVDPSDFDINESDFTATLKEGSTPKRLFNAIEVNDLGDTSATTLEYVFDECRQLSGISAEDIEQVSGELKNDQNGNSG